MNALLEIDALAERAQRARADFERTGAEADYTRLLEAEVAWLRARLGIRAEHARNRGDVEARR